eukprot:m.23361 g.23361  ORF g.23361 m.23361 type:complete len:193 (-) comp34985_c0_seq1:135-713(-)
MAESHVKLVVVGDGFCGKTSLLIQYSSNTFCGDYAPTIFDNFSKLVDFEGKPVHLGLWDTAGQAEYDRLRPLSYPQTNAFLVCFSVAEPTTFKHVSAKWLPEIRHYNPATPIVLVGLKSDLRDDAKTLAKLADQQLQPISYAQGAKFAKDNDIFAYAECSALKGRKVQELFHECIRAATQRPPKKQKLCTIL